MPALIIILFALSVNAFGLTTFSASVPKWVVIYGWASIAVAMFAVYGRATVDRVDLSAVALFLWASLSMLWTPDPLQGAYALSNAAALLAVFLFLRRYPWSVPKAALIALFLALALHWIYPPDVGGQGNRNFQTEVILLLLCLIVLGHHSKAVIAAFIVPAMMLSGWVLMVENTSKIEYAVFAALAVSFGYEYINVAKQRRKPG